jgi:hypothetical protein
MGGASVGRSFVSVRSTVPREVKVEISGAWVVEYQFGVGHSFCFIHNMGNIQSRSEYDKNILV